LTTEVLAKPLPEMTTVCVGLPAAMVVTERLLMVGGVAMTKLVPAELTPSAVRTLITAVAAVAR
jgi:hypothetical protein